MTRPNQARRGGSVKRGKKFLQEKPGMVWHLSRQIDAQLTPVMGLTIRYVPQQQEIILFPNELRALYTRLWYLEKAGKIKRIKP